MQVGGVPRGAARVCAVGSWQDARKGQTDLMMEAPKQPH